MSTKGTLFLDDTMQVHVFHDCLDNCIHLAVEGQGEVVLTPEMWRDLVATVAGDSLRTAGLFKLGDHPPRPLCQKCGAPDVAHMTSGPCQEPYFGRAT